jgi:acyl-CoA oxidase
LGGAGFTAWSGLPQIIVDCAPATTYEGDNTVMAQQSARYIFKQVSKVMKGEKCVGVFGYLNEVLELIKSDLKCSAKTPEEFVDLHKIDEALKVNVCY